MKLAIFLGQNVVIEYRFAEGSMINSRDLQTDLVRRPVNVLVATGRHSLSNSGPRPIIPAMIPLVFAMGGDPVELGDCVAASHDLAATPTGVEFLRSTLWRQNKSNCSRELAATRWVIGSSFSIPSTLPISPRK